jgi:hypothetical protein
MRLSMTVGHTPPGAQFRGGNKCCGGHLLSSLSALAPLACQCGARSSILPALSPAAGSGFLCQKGTKLWQHDGYKWGVKAGAKRRNTPLKGEAVGRLAARWACTAIGETRRLLLTGRQASLSLHLVSPCPLPPSLPPSRSRRQARPALYVPHYRRRPPAGGSGCGWGLHVEGRWVAHSLQDDPAGLAWPRTGLSGASLNACTALPALSCRLLTVP